ncbi:hypothetical protein, partial [Solemya velum gill symbiont]|uniref:hypothetical protein n=1 Tax=Solemya velum gill symbiont TaxID=2340 RepID=UPI001C4E0A6E
IVEIGRSQSQKSSIMKEIQKSVLIPYEKYMRCVEENRKTDGPIESRERDLSESPEVHGLSEPQVGSGGLSMDMLLSMIPKHYTYKVKTILIHVLNDPKHTLLWNGRGELLYEGKEIEGSNIVDLLKDSQREYGHGSPNGLTEFYRGLKEINIPRSLIGNAQRLNTYLDGHMGLPPGIPQRDGGLEKLFEFDLL